jgi:hypothetical protein
MITSLSSRLPQSHTLLWATILLHAIKYIALATIGGAIGTLLFYRRQSPWMFLVIALATVASAFSLRRLFPVISEPDQRKAPDGYTSDLPNLYGLPIAAFRPVRAFFIAICAQAALLLAVADRPSPAGLLLSICLALLVWRWSALDSSTIKQFAGRRQSILLSALALCFTVLALLPWIAEKSYGSKEVPRRPALITHESKEADVPGSDYVGIILWPPPIKKTAIVPPRPHTTSFTIGKASKPLVIPFDGQYWYFKAPSKRPGPRAHIAHGRATYVNVHSTDSAPLLMEAYQNLGTSIDLGCCSEIDVAITNADIRPGTIALGIRLTDSTSVAEPSQDLGERTIVSSKTAQIPLSRPPVEEVLRFPIPRPTTIHRFDEITIVFRSAKERARGGAKVSIQSFTLIPR